jgi:hypothetical protein
MVGGAGISGGVARAWRGAREGLGAGPGGRGTPALAMSRVLPATWRRGGCDIQPRQPLHSCLATSARGRPRVFMLAPGGAGWPMRSRGTSFHQLPAGLAHRDPRAAGPRDPFGARPQSRSRARRALATQRGTPHQQHQHHGQRCGVAPPPHITYLVHSYGEICPFRLHQIRDKWPKIPDGWPKIRDGWPTQGRVIRVITAGAVRSDLRAAHRPHGARTGHRLGRAGETGGWRRRGPGVTASVTFP